MRTLHASGPGEERFVENQLILDRYRPLRELGRGGFATVVLAWDTRMQRRVAIKRLPLPLDSAGRPLRPPGLVEARTAAMLGHPAIVTALDFDTDSDEAFIVMEFVDGASLVEVLTESDGPLTLDEAATIAEAVAGALEYAHDNGVLHLDIKPENVLVTRDGRVKVTDFGMSELSTLAGHGAAYGGTPGYMPLEQLEGRDVSVRTDEWALASLLYEVLTGENPFLEASAPAAFARLEEFDPPPPSSYVPELSAEIDDALLTALGDRPQDRFADVTTFVDELLPHLGDVIAGAESLAELVSAFALEEEQEPGFAEDRVGLWDRLGGRSGSLLLRTAAVVESGWLAWAGLTPFALETSALLAAVALIALAALLAPSLGVGLGIGCLVAGLAANGAAAAAVLIGVGAATWWWLLARKNPGAAVLPLAAPVLGGARLGFAQPLLAGFSLAPVPAAATALLGGGLMFAASAATLHGAPYSAVGTLIAADPWNAGVATNALSSLFRSPATYVAWAGWPLSAAIMSLSCARATRGGAVLGAIAGTAALAGAYVVADELARTLRLPETSESWAGAPLAWALGASLILMALVIALGAPMRAEDDEPFAPTEQDD